MKAKKRKRLIRSLKRIREQLRPREFDYICYQNRLVNSGKDRELVEKYLKSFNSTNSVWFKSHSDRLKWLDLQIESLELL